MDKQTLKQNAAMVMGYARSRIVWILIIAVFIMAVVWTTNKLGTDTANCSTMNSLYETRPPISTLNTNDSDFNYGLRDYYIKTAYNCCSAGQYKNDFVNICALENCIKAGVRCLDFAVYSVDNRPVIAVSLLDDYHTKESYNSVPFGEAMQVIAANAFSSGATTCAGDPLLIHLRIMSKNEKIYTEMTKDIYSTLQPFLLGKKYSYENHGENLGKTNIKELKGKVVIIVDKANPIFSKTPLNEYVNLTSNSVFMRALQYHDVKFTHNMDELIEFNKKNMTICLPDLTSATKNPSASVAMAYGCQMVAMSFQNFDANLEYVSLFFNNAGSAFSLKPERLRYIPVTIPDPPAQNPAYSYGKRDIKIPGGSLNI